MPVGGAFSAFPLPKKRGFYSIFVVAVTDFRNMKIVSLALSLRLKWLNLFNLDQKLIVPNDY